MENITRFRGDTRPDKFSMLDSDGNAVNITSYTIVLTVNRTENPTDSSAQVFQIAATITNAAAGEYEFRPSALQANQTPGTYYYDVQVTDTGGFITTLGKARYIFVQDITKV